MPIIFILKLQRQTYLKYLSFEVGEIGLGITAEAVRGLARGMAQLQVSAQATRDMATIPAK